jgi:hypothetical protein
MNNSYEEKGSGAGQGFGVAGFVLGLIALILSFIPCLGMYALVPGVIAIVFSAVAFLQAGRANAPRGLIIAALVISILGSSLATWQIVMVQRATSGIGKIGTGLQDIFRDGFEIPPPGETDDADTVVQDSEEMIRELERLEGKRENASPENDRNENGPDM